MGERPGRWQGLNISLTSARPSHHAHCADVREESAEFCVSLSSYAASSHLIVLNPAPPTPHYHAFVYFQQPPVGHSADFEHLRREMANHAQLPCQGAPDISTSTIFGPTFQVDGLPPDVVLISTDNVTFHVHTQRLRASSTNAFGRRLTQPITSLSLPETSAVLNVALHILYNMSCLQFQPSLEDIEAAISALLSYGVPQTLLQTSQPLYRLILSNAPYRPIEAYVLAGHHGLETTAIAVSAHLLAYDLSKLSDELTIKMGSVYFSRLYKLQHARLAALRNIVLRPPIAHPPTLTCNEETQGQLSRAWAFASAEMVWNALPSTSVGALQSTFGQAGASIACPDCQAMIRNRIAEVTHEWSAIKRTI
ncbi:hypothetical protein BC628DRAFT_1420480 [Trametes gibbosa]|nr:hypothetical protein BC628DRAFT_1420480 [Trametes gibbosa]